MRGVFVYEQEAVLQFDNDIGFQGLAQDLVVGNREVINILNSFFDRVRLDGRYRGDGTGDLIGVRRTFKSVCCCANASFRPLPELFSR